MRQKQKLISKFDEFAQGLKEQNLEDLKQKDKEINERMKKAAKGVRNQKTLDSKLRLKTKGK